MASEGPRATIKKRHSRTVGRGPVPRHRPRTPTIAGDRPPRYDKKRLPLTVGRGPVPRQHPRTSLCSSGAPAPDLFVIRRSQTTEVGTMSPGNASRPGGLSYRAPFFHRRAGGWHRDVARVMKHPQLKFIDDAGRNNKGKLRNLR